MNSKITIIFIIFITFFFYGCDREEYTGTLCIQITTDSYIQNLGEFKVFSLSNDDIPITQKTKPRGVDEIKIVLNADNYRITGVIGGSGLNPSIIQINKGKTTYLKY